MNVQQSLVRVVRQTALAVCAVSLFGCASVKLTTPNASGETVQTLRGANIVPAKTGKFTLAAGKDARLDHNLDGLRGSSMTPNDGSFSNDLRNVIVTDLKAAGLYDESSDAVIEAQLVDSRVDAAIGTGTGRLAAHFTVTRGGKSVFDKQLAVDASWESSFIGGIAIPTAMQQYGALYQALATKLFADPDFRTALAH